MCPSIPTSSRSSCNEAGRKTTWPTYCKGTSCECLRRWREWVQWWHHSFQDQFWSCVPQGDWKDSSLVVLLHKGVSHTLSSPSVSCVQSHELLTLWLFQVRDELSSRPPSEEQIPPELVQNPCRMVLRHPDQRPRSLDPGPRSRAYPGPKLLVTVNTAVLLFSLLNTLSTLPNYWAFKLPQLDSELYGLKLPSLYIYKIVSRKCSRLQLVHCLIFVLWRL